MEKHKFIQTAKEFISKMEVAGKPYIMYTPLNMNDIGVYDSRAERNFTITTHSRKSKPALRSININK